MSKRRFRRIGSRRPPRRSISRSWLILVVVVVVGVLASSCVGDDEPQTSGPDTTDEPASTTSAPEPPTTSTTVASPEIPSGPYYLPTDLPDGWELTALRFFAGDSEVFGFGVDSSGADSVSLIVHRSDAGFDTGGATLTVSRFPDGDAVLPDGLGFGEAESLEIPGLVSARLEYDDVETSFGSVVALLDERTSLSLIGSVSRDELVDIAGAVRVDDGEEIEVALDLDGWVTEPRGEVGQLYLLGLRGPEGTVEISVSPGATEAALYIGGRDFESLLDGEVGTGYFAVQRIEDQNLEFPSVHWWVPNVLLHSSVGPELDLIAQILDGFVEVDEAAFRSAVADIAVEVIPTESAPPTDAPDPESESESLDPETLARLIDVVETALGRDFDDPPTVSIADGEALRASVPDGSFVSEDLWAILLALGLVDGDDSRADADAARRDQLRGVCCPVTVIDTGDPLFNEIVIVHELTHGLDADLGSSGSSSVEVVSPSLALVEGNAHRVAFDYADVLNQAGADLPPPPAVFPPGGDRRVPPAVQRVLEFPYHEGWEFAVALAEHGGEEAIVEAFGQPPASSEQIMNLDAYLDGDRPANVRAPTPPAGVTVERQGTIGAFLLSLVAEPTTGPDRAIEIANAWDGDAFILYGQDGLQCLDATIQFDDEAAADDLAEAFEAAGLSVTVEQRSLDVTRCL